MAEDEHFVDKHQLELIRRVRNVSPILDELLQYKVIRQREYDKIRTLATSQEKMRALFRGPLESSGVQGKEIFYKILNIKEPYLINDLKKRVQEETMTDKKILSETLKDLSSEEFEEFKSFIELELGFPRFTSGKMEVENTQDMVELMVATYSREFVELTKIVLKKMNRTDLVQRLLDISPGAKEKQYPSLTQRVETMASVIELLLETLKSLSDRELKEFKDVLTHIHSFRPDFHEHYSFVPWMQLEITDIQNLVFLMVLTYGQKSVKMTEEALKKIKKTDLVQRLSDSSSGPRKKESVDERLSALIHKVATMTAVKEMLLETLNDLSPEERKNFKWLLKFRFFQRSLPHISSLQLADSADILVNVMVDKYGQQSVELTKEVFMDLNRADLVQRLPETSSGPEEKHSLDEHWPALIQKVESMVSVIELLLETLKDLSGKELEEFTEVLWPKIRLASVDLSRPRDPLVIDVQDTVFEIVQIYGQQKTKEALQKINRTDLVQRLSDSSSPKKKPSADKRCSAVIQRVATMAAVKQLLLETLNDLSNEELERFKELLQLLVSHKGLGDISVLNYFTDRAHIVDLMLQTYSQQSVELTREVFMEMRRNDLVQKLSKPSSGLKEKHSVDEHRPAPSERAAAITAVKQILLETLNHLSHREFQKFKWLLPFTFFEMGLPQISYHLLQYAETADRLVDELVCHGQQSVEVIKEVFMDMNRTDLLQRLSQFSSGPEGPSTSLKSDVGGSMMLESSDWTILEPEVSSTDAHEASTYSLQSEAGSFECSVSGLRWVCKQKVCFKYQFCSWEEHMERMEGMKYMPAGPLIDITVISGKLDEVYLPHWICLDDNPKISDKFAALHIDDYGDVVEKVSEVTPSHVKLSEPVFSPRGALMKAGFPVKIRCIVLIYKSNIAFLTLHVYLIPSDPGLEQAIDKKKESNRFDIIHKPPPSRSLKMRDRFILTADLDGAEIYPENLKLKYERSRYFEVYIKNPDTNFKLNLTKEKEDQPVWTGAIRRDEYKSTGHIQDAAQANPPSVLTSCTKLSAEGEACLWEKHSVEEHLSARMQKQATITTDRERILEMLEHLKQEEFEKFKWFLEGSDILEGLPRISRSQLENRNMLDVVDLLLQTYRQQSVEVTKKVFRKMNRNDLVQML